MKKKKLSKVVIIDFPKISKFVSKSSKDMSPYEKFHFYCASFFGGMREGELINVAATCVNTADYLKLREIAYNWAFSFCSSKEQLDKSFPQHEIECAPEQNIKVTPGQIYVRPDKLFVKQD